MTFVIIGLILLFCFSTPYGSAFIITLLLRMIVLRYTTTVTMSTLTIFPLSISHLKLSIGTFLRTSYHSRLVVSISSLKFSFHWRQWLFTLFSASPHKPIHITINGMRLAVHDICLDDVLSPRTSSDSSAATDNVARRKQAVGRWITRLFDVVFVDTAVDINFNKESISVLLSCQTARIRVNPSAEDTSVDVLELDTAGHSVTLTHGQVQAIRVSGDHLLVRGRRYRSTGFVELLAEYLSDSSGQVNVQALLAFYEVYQRAEDLSIDVKVSRGLSRSGKIRLMHADIHRISLNICDVRNEMPLDIVLDTLCLEMSNRDVVQGQSPTQSQSQSHQREKCMAASFLTATATGTGFNGTVVEGMDICRKVKVVNERNLLDAEDVTVTAKSIRLVALERASPVLHWLCTLQSIAGSLPASRHRHGKTSRMTFLGFDDETNTGGCVCSNFSNFNVVRTSQTAAPLPPFTTSVLEDPAKSMSSQSLSSPRTTLVMTADRLHMATQLCHQQICPSSNNNNGDVTCHNDTTSTETGAGTRTRTEDNPEKLSPSPSVMTAAVVFDVTSLHVDLCQRGNQGKMALDRIACVEVAVSRLDNWKKKNSSDNGNDSSIDGNGKENVLPQLLLLQKLEVSFSAVRTAYGITTVFGRLGVLDVIALRMIQGLVKTVLDRVKGAQRHASQSQSQDAAESDPLPVPQRVFSVSHLHLEVAMEPSGGGGGVVSDCPPTLTQSQTTTVTIVLTKLAIKREDPPVSLQGVSWRRMYVYLRNEHQVDFLSVEYFNYNSTPSHVSCAVQSVRVTSSEAMFVGSSVDSLLNQYNALRLVMRGGNSPSPSPTEPVAPRVSSYNIKNLEVSLEGWYKGTRTPHFITLKLSALIVDTVPRKTLQEAVNEIRDIDSEYSSGLDFDVMSGGDLSMTWAELRFSFAPMDVPFLLLTRCSLKGPAYRAVVIDDRVKTWRRGVLLLNGEGRGLDGATAYLPRSHAPGKIYLDVDLHISQLLVNADLITTACLGAVGPAILPCQLPQPQPVTPLLPWDSFRYWVHGSLRLNVAEIKVSHSLQDKSGGEVRLVASIASFRFLQRPGVVEVSGTDLAVDIEMEDGNGIDSGWSSGRVGGAGRSPGSVDGKTNSSRLCLIPKISFAMNHKRFMEGIHSHHDIYLHRPDNNNNNKNGNNSYDSTEDIGVDEILTNDKFHLFRSRPNSCQWEVTLECADGETKPLTIWARLDVIHRWLEAFGNSSGPPTPAPTTQTLSEDFQPTAFDAATTATTAGAVSDQSVRRLSLMDTVALLDIHVHMKRFVACSWLSNTDFQGMAFVQRQLDVQLRLRREEEFSCGNSEGDGEGVGGWGDRRLEVDHLSAEILDMDAYVRDWRIQNSPIYGFDPQKNVYEEQTSGTGDSDREPRSISELTGLFSPLCKFCHATKVQASFMQQDEIDDFSSSSQQKKKSTDEMFLDRTRTRARTCSGASDEWRSMRGGTGAGAGGGETMSVDSNGSSTSAAKDEPFKPSLRHFLSNHSALAPPKSSLPPSYQLRWLPRTPRKPMVGVTSPRIKEKASATGAKIWALRVLEVRLLWTVDIRDKIFAYGAKYIQLFITQSSEEIRRVLAKTAPKKKEPSKREATATMVDFLDRANVRRRRHSLHYSDSSTNSGSAPGLGLGSLSRELDMDVDGDVDVEADHTKTTTTTTTSTISAATAKSELTLAMLSAFEAPQPTATDNINNPRAKTALPKYLHSQSHRIVTSPSDARRAIQSLRMPTPLPSQREQEETRTLLQEQQSINDKAAEDKATGLYFVIEFVDPQLNFMDDKVEGSVVIVAGAAAVEGKRSVAAHVSSHKKLQQQQSSSGVPKRRYEVRLRMDGVSMFTVPTNLEGEPTVHWHTALHTPHPILSSIKFPKPAQRLSPMDFITQSLYSTQSPAKSSTPEVQLLQLAVKDFQIRASYSYYMDVTVAEAGKMYLQHLEEELISRFYLNLPEICMELDSAQFFIVLHVVRNVLLSPPPPLIPHTQPLSQGGNGSSSNNDAGMEDPATRSSPRRKRAGSVATGGGGEVVDTVPIDLDSRQGREEMKSLVEQFLDSIRPTGTGTGTGTGDKGDPVIVEGADTKDIQDRDRDRDRPKDGRMSRHVEYNVGRGMWSLKGLKSGGDLVEVGFLGLNGSHCFLEDRSSTTLFEVQRFWAQNKRRSAGPGPDVTGFEDPSVILSTLRKDDQDELCRRCGSPFEPQENTSASCCWHADSDGTPGQFRLCEGRGGWQWSCCGKSLEEAPGCAARTHICKDIMLSVRAEANPSVVIGGVDLIVFKTLEFSIFPGSTNTLQVQVTRSLVDLLHQYFVIERGDDEDRGDDGTAKLQLVGAAPLAVTPFLSRGVFRGGTTAASTDRQVGKTGRGRGGGGGGHDAELVSALPLAPSTRREGLYVKYLRVGEVIVKVSTGGFPINLSEYKAAVAPFVKHGKVLSWQRLVHKLERHATWSLTKNTASTSLSLIRDLFFGKPKDVSISEDDDVARKTALLGAF
eukprot:gene1161-2253_t